MGSYMFSFWPANWDQKKKSAFQFLFHAGFSFSSLSSFPKILEACGKSVVFCETVLPSMPKFISGILTFQDQCLAPNLFFIQIVVNICNGFLLFF